MNREEYIRTTEDQETMDLKEMIEKYLYHWKWFLLSVVVVIFCAYAYLRYTLPVYQTTAKLLIEDDKKSGSGTADLAAFSDLEIFSRISNLQNEIEWLRSFSLVEKVVQELDLQKRYVEKSRDFGLQDREIYQDLPFYLKVHDSIMTSGTIRFKIKMESERRFSLTYTMKDEEESDPVLLSLGQRQRFPFGTISLERNGTVMTPATQQEYEIVYSSKKQVARAIIRNMTIAPVNKESSVLSIAYKGNLPDKNEAIVNELIRQYELDKLNDKKEVTQKTREFIDERMEVISEELQAEDLKSLRFKKENQIVDIEANASAFMTRETEIDKRIIEVEIQLELARFVDDYLDQYPGGDNVLIPGNLGFQDQTIARMIDSYNGLVLEHAKLVANSTEKNPVVIQLAEQIASIRTSLQRSLQNLVRASEMELASLETREEQFRENLAKIPDFEKEFRDIQRQQQIKETLYLYLLQKREENEIVSAATISNTKVIDYAITNSAPVAPRKNIILLASFLVGLLIPAGVIYLKDQFDTKVKGPKDIESAGLPYMGLVPKTTEERMAAAMQDPHSPVIEAFRMLRTNLSFMTDMTQPGKVLMVTSTLAQEGKTFSVLHLGHSLVLSGKRVLIVDLDLRQPKVAIRLELDNSAGMTNLLVDEGTDPLEWIHRDVVLEGMDVLTSGPIPPNPSELLLRDRFNTVMDVLKSEYDVILLDTAPVGLVADTLIAGSQADATLFVVKSGKLDKRMLGTLRELISSGKLQNVGVVLNSVDLKNSKYGYGYGYGNQQEKKPWWKIF